MPDKPKAGADKLKLIDDDLIKRIDEAPRVSREELLEAVLPKEVRRVRNGLLHGTTPPAAEWIDLADAGPYVDETELPLYSPNGDGTGGTRSYGNAATEARTRDLLARIGSDTSARSAGKAREKVATEQNAAIDDEDTELKN